MKFSLARCCSASFLLRPILGIAFGIVCANALLAQTNNRANGGAPIFSSDVRYPEWQLKNSFKIAKPGISIRPDWTRARADFVELQRASHQLIGLTTAGANLKLESLALQIGEINKRAKRLKQQLPLPKLSAQQQRLTITQFAEFPIAAAFAELDDSVLRFTANPVFKNEFTVDAENALRAKLDLEQILAGSRILKKRLTAAVSALK